MGHGQSSMVTLEACKKQHKPENVQGLTSPLLSLICSFLSLKEHTRFEATCASWQRAATSSLSYPSTLKITPGSLLPLSRLRSLRPLSLTIGHGETLQWTTYMTAPVLDGWDHRMDVQWQRTMCTLTSLQRLEIMCFATFREPHPQDGTASLPGFLNHLQHLEHLSLHFSPISWKFELQTTLPKLISLELHGTTFGAMCPKEFGPHMPNLERLVLSNVPILIRDGDDGTDGYAALGTLQQLRSLRLYDSHYFEPQDVSKLHRLAHVLTHCKHLEVFQVDIVINRYTVFEGIDYEQCNDAWEAMLITAKAKVKLLKRMTLHTLFLTGYAEFNGTFPE